MSLYTDLDKAINYIQDISTGVNTRYLTGIGVWDDSIPMLGGTTNLLGARCLSGDTIVKCGTETKRQSGREYTLKQLYERWHGIYLKHPRHKFDRSKKILILAAVGNNIKYIEILDVYYSGIKEVFLIKTSSGKTIKSTKDHKFLTGSGYVKLSDLNVGCNVFCRNSQHKIKTSRTEKIISIESVGIEETYDISCVEPNNFIANGFVVHNSGAGKTRFMMQVISNMMKMNYKIAFLCAEDKQENIMVRLLSDLTKSFQMKDAFMGRLNRTQVENLRLFIENFKDSNNLYVKSTVGWSLKQVMDKIKLLKERGVQVIFYDYLQRIETPGVGGMFEKNAMISRTIVDYITTTNICMIGVVQLNRQSNDQGQDPNKNPPTIAGIKGSGAYEEDAYSIAMLQREQIPDQWEGWKYTDNLFLYVRKNRLGGDLKRYKLDTHYKPIKTTEQISQIIKGGKNGVNYKTRNGA